MDFLISGTHIHPVYLIAVGFIVGICGGFFGVGGSFLAGPALFFFGVPMNFVVGTDLAHIVGKSIVAAKKHRVLGNVDIKLGLIMAAATIVGVETGAQLIQQLKRHNNVDLVVAIAFVVVLVGISTFIAWECWQTLKMGKETTGKSSGGKPRRDHSALAYIAKNFQRFHLPPMISLPNSGIKQISLWTILVVSYVGGMFSGFLGGGAGYIRMPAMVYILGVPTHIAVGTDLFEIIISASYGTFTHALKGNVDILIALVMHTGAAIGAQIGATLTQYFHGVRIRLAFIPLPLLGAGLIIYSLMTGHHFK
ncbi:MAG TPA: sulfite exporter TauE/SafE family protein [Verrucomicrobiae bacterium]|nr:sulfite exporter TauE/SafE family protein [Verrucomicrobiae bacterium]